MSDDPLVFLVAGEASGDLLGARLMAALKRLTGGRIRFAGVGGAGMIQEGLTSLFSMDDLAVMGVAEVLPRLRTLLRRIETTTEAVLRLRPAAVVTIDAPDFSFRVARRVKRRDPGIPLIHYVAPQVWAWRPGRARMLAGFLDHLLALFPFEPPLFEAVGLGCSFVGHSVIETGVQDGDGARFRTRHGIATDRPLVVMLPGSRHGELRRLLPVFGETVSALARRPGGIAVAVPTLPGVRPIVATAVASWPVPVTLVDDVAGKFDAFAAGDVALAASGTVALELALAGLPMVTAYRVNAITAALVGQLVRVRFANLVNIMHDRAVVPELLQQECRPDRLAAAVTTLLDDADARRAQIEGLAAVGSWLGVGGTPPSERAAAVVLARLRA